MENWKIEKDLCRCCHSEGSFRPLTEMCAIGGEEAYYIDMLRLTLHVTLTPVEGPLHPNTYTICDECIVRVKDATAFKQQVRLCEERFQDMFSKGVIKIEDHPVIKIEPYTDDQKMDSDDVPDVNAIEPHRPWRADGDDLPDEDDVDDAFEREVKVDIEVCKVEPDPINTKRRSGRTKKPVVKPQDKKEKPKRQPRKPKVQPETSAEGENAAKKVSGKQASVKVIGKITKHTEHGLVSYSCNICGQGGYATIFSARDHFKKHHKTRQKRSLCDKSFRFHLEKRKHILNHVKEEFKVGSKNIPVVKVVCDICKQEFKCKENLVKHINGVHTMEKCLECSITVSSRKMKYHKAITHGIGGGTCGICGYKSIKRLVEYHQRRVHLKEKNVTCPECDAKFFTITMMKRHFITHNPVKKFECSYCKKKFPRRNTLRQHEKIHTGDKRKVCAICDARFVQKASLNYHMAKHHPEAC